MEIDPKIVVLLTTWNRPNLLEQSLPQIERECKAINAKLVIADDQSDDPKTIELLDGAASRGAEIVRRPYTRSKYSIPNEIKAYAHEMIGLNNIFAIKHILEDDDAEYFIKVDDDIWLRHGAFKAMIAAWRLAERDEVDVLAVSGIHGIYESIIVDAPKYYIIHAGCFAAILFKKEDWRIFFETSHPGNIIVDGFDCHFSRVYKRKFRDEASYVATKPSVVYHTGINGTHMPTPIDINVDFEGPIDEIKCE